MSNEEIRFNRGEASVYLNRRGKVKYENDKDKTLKNNLQSIFDSIAGLDGNKHRIDTEQEKTLLKMLQTIFSADDDASISDAELDWIKSFDGSDVAQFIGKKNNDIQQEKADAEAAEQARIDAQRQAEEQAKLEAEAQAKAEQEAKEAEERARLEAEAKQAAIAEKRAARAAFDNSINRIKENTNSDGVSDEDYTIQKGDSFWRIAERQLRAESGTKPTNKAIMERIALIAKINGIDSVTGYKLYAGHTLKVPTSGGATPPSGATIPNTPVNITEESDADNLSDYQSMTQWTLWTDGTNFYVVKENETNDTSWSQVDAAIYQDDDNNLYYVRN